MTAGPCRRPARRLHPARRKRRGLAGAARAGEPPCASIAATAAACVAQPCARQPTGGLQENKYSLRLHPGVHSRVARWHAPHTWCTAALHGPRTAPLQSAAGWRPRQRASPLALLLASRPRGQAGLCALLLAAAIVLGAVQGVVHLARALQHAVCARVRMCTCTRVLMTTMISHGHGSMPLHVQALRKARPCESKKRKGLGHALARGPGAIVARRAGGQAGGRTCAHARLGLCLSSSLHPHRPPHTWLAFAFLLPLRLRFLNSDRSHLRGARPSKRVGAPAAARACQQRRAQRAAGSGMRMPAAPCTARGRQRHAHCSAPYLGSQRSGSGGGRPPLGSDGS